MWCKRRYYPIDLIDWQFLDDSFLIKNGIIYWKEHNDVAIPGKTDWTFLLKAVHCLIATVFNVW